MDGFTAVLLERLGHDYAMAVSMKAGLLSLW